MSCIVESASEAGLNVAAGTTGAAGAPAATRSAIPWSEVRWAVLSPGARPPETAAGHFVELADGTRFRVQSFEVHGGTLAGQDGEARFSLGPPLADRLARLRVYSDAYRYLSDLGPQKVTLQPFLDTVWPPRLDGSPGGGLLTLAGEAYEKGIAMDARTEMTFALNRAYSRFYATVGVDDSSPAGLGRVVFRVLADGRALFDSRLLSGGDGPHVLALDIRNVDKLTLVADFGSRVSVGGNFADWADARVTK